jgi:hypothetical protein
MQIQIQLLKGKSHEKAGGIRRDVSLGHGWVLAEH